LVTVAIVQRCDYTNHEEEKYKTDDLMKELDKPHNEICKTLLTQLKRIAGELREYFDQRPNHDASQWVVATPLNITRSTGSGAEPLILTKQAVDVNKHIYSNFKKREKYCNDYCYEKVRKLPTKINRNKTLNKNHVIHTEIQMLYREKADNILHDEANKNKIILVYSKYIPCSQNQDSQGGTFVECAGELANFIINENPYGNKLIVFYEKQHESNRNAAGVTVSSVVGVSQLYMEMSGIVAFKYTPGQDGTLVRDPQLVKQADYFREHPMFLHLGRPLMNKNYKATVSQIFIDCLARNDFVMPVISQKVDYLAVRFKTVKNFLSRLPHAMGNKLEDLVTAANEGKNPTKQQRAIVKGCHVFVNEMRKYHINKEPCLITEQEETDYLTFESFSAETTEPLVQGEEDNCKAYLKALNEYFKIKTREQDVCLANYHFNGDSYESNRGNCRADEALYDNRGNEFCGNSPN